MGIRTAFENTKNEVLNMKVYTDREDQRPSP